MTTTYLPMPADLLSQLGTNERFTREVNFAHSCCDQYSVHKHYCTMYGGKRYITTLEQKEQAQKLYEINKQKAIKNVGNKLVFVGMGCEYKARYEDDVCNHRIRTEIVNPQGRRFFIEVGTWGNELMRIDHVVDRDQEDEYNAKAQECRDKIEAAGGFWRVGKGHELYTEYDKYMSQPYYWYKREQWQDLKTKYTNKNVLDLVNSLFNCNFTEIEVDYCHLTTDDYSSVSPKKELQPA
jgi:hypothetical protein